ncbi:MAG: hypothetical protein R3E97_08585 [Candidatus Eisenbacteria bacterium]
MRKYSAFLVVSLLTTPAYSSSVEDVMQQMAALEVTSDDASLEAWRKGLLALKAYEEAGWLIRMRALDSAAAPEAKRELAYLHLKSGQFPEAVVYYQQLLDGGRGTDGDWQMLAYVLGEAGDFALAANVYVDLLRSADPYVDAERMPTSGPLPYAFDLIVDAKAAGRVAEVEPLVRRVREILLQASESPKSEPWAVRALEDLGRHTVE